MSKKPKIGKEKETDFSYGGEAAFGYLEEIVNAPRDMVVTNSDYYQGFMHGVTAVTMYGGMAEEGDDLGEFLIRKWFNIKDER